MPPFVFNGLNAATGNYLTPPLTAAQISNFAQGKPPDAADLRELNQKADLVKQQRGDPSKAKWALKEGLDPKDLAQAGWGVIFADGDEKETAALKEALQPLLEHRQAQAAKAKAHYYREFVGPQGVKLGDDKRLFLARHKVGTSGPVDPEKAPYYLLIVGSPEKIPYRFQYQLDVQYAVGRVHFDQLEDYHQYALNVVRLEQAGAARAQTAAFFGTANPGDRATQLSAEQLIKPLAASTAQDKPEWAISMLTPAQSTKAQLSALLNGPERPALLFAASHGISFPKDDPEQRQFRHQGALVCQDWPGPKAGPISASQYFSADDLAPATDLAGLVGFFFACFGAGTPQVDEFAGLTGQRDPLAPRPFVAGLPRQMLLQGALAVVGHVDRAWSTSFADGTRTQIVTFQSALKRLMEDHPIGSATEYFNGRYAEISSDLTSYIDEHQGLDLDDDQVANLWTANNDARNYVVVGDPAVRLPHAGAGAPPPTRAAELHSPAEAAANPGADLTHYLAQKLASAPGFSDVSEVQMAPEHVTVQAKYQGKPVTVQIDVRITEA